ncbi:MAG: rRNA maturation RNase YbeY [Clostridiaceae bacterium]|jgi:probable rRNA maturation factor|nr:rRNA maturation RNase YbeY [Clostridiaceae bacterium]
MTPEINIFSENIYSGKTLDEKALIKSAKIILEFYLSIPEIYSKSCLNKLNFDVISFDFLYCDNEKTHEINRDYRGKDYAADIITFAIFADTEPVDRIIFDGEINLGEILISLDGVKTEAEKAEKTFDDELVFLISHGILHLLGFDHQTMEEYNFVVDLQNRAIESLNTNINRGNDD